LNSNSQPWRRGIEKAITHVLLVPIYFPQLRGHQDKKSVAADVDACLKAKVRDQQEQAPEPQEP
jgi:hypothetical protein